MMPVVENGQEGRGGGGGGGVRVVARRLSSLEVVAGTLHPRCQVLVGLLASLPPIVFSRVALSWWPGALFWQVALVCLFPTRWPWVGPTVIAVVTLGAWMLGLFVAELLVFAFEIC